LISIREFDEKYGRQVLIGAVLLIWGAILWSILANGYLETWYRWGIPAKLPPFVDFRLIPGSAETFRAGIDPAVSNPNDPRGRIFNYPKIWYLLFYTGISQDDTIWICIVLLVLFFLIVCAFPERMRVRDALMTLGIVFSPACVLLYERGNVDLIIFILCGLVILSLGRSPGFAASILSFGAFLKFFPFFGATVFFDDNKSKFYKMFVASTIALAIYLAFSFDSVMTAWSLTERGTFISYGVYVVFDLLHAYLQYYLIRILSEAQLQTAMNLLPHLISGMLLAGLSIPAAKERGAFNVSSQRNLAAFRMGASIYVGTFLLGNNWNYRLAFLIFAVPQLAQWFFTVPSKNRWLFLGILIALFVSCWESMIIQFWLGLFDGEFMLQLSIFDEIMNWLLFAGLAYLLIASAPAWFRTLSWNPFGRETLANVIAT